jgi:hypothetical protein
VAHHPDRGVATSVRRGWRLLLEKKQTVGLPDSSRLSTCMFWARLSRRATTRGGVAMRYASKIPLPALIGVLVLGVRGRGGIVPSEQAVTDAISVFHMTQRSINLLI